MTVATATLLPDGRCQVRRRAKPYRLKAPVVPEHPLQKQIADTLRIEIGPPAKLSRHGVIWFAIDHANYAGEVPGVRVGRGIVEGLPDNWFLYRGKAHVIELKSAEGSLTDAQQSVIAACALCGVSVGVADRAEDVLTMLDEWAIPRNRRVRIAA